MFSNDIGTKVGCLKGNSCRVYKIIFKQAKEVSYAKSINEKIEDKIVFSIALRIFGEKYMYSKLKPEKKQLSPGFDFDKAEFGHVLGELKKYTKIKKKNKVLDIISILTPMEIHVNSFAYEPLIDYSITRMRTLFKELISFMPQSLLYK